MLILLAGALVLAFSIFVLAVMRLPGRAAYVTGLFLLSYANIVLAGEIANTAGQLNNPWLWLGLHLAFLAAAVFGWLRAGRPALWANFKGGPGVGGWRVSLRQHPELWLLSIGVGLAYLLGAAIIWVAPPNNNDSLSTHLARVGFWLQRGSFFPWQTDRVWQITYPVNAQLQMFWSALFLGSDRLVEGLQWLGALAALAAIYGLARLMGASRAQAGFAALLWATFPEIVLQSTTTQNDLVAGTLFAGMLYLLFLGLSGRHPGALVLSGMALGLGAGTKQTLLFLLPGLTLVAGLVLIYRGRQALRWLILWGASAAAAFLLLGAYMYAANLVIFGHPMGPKSAVAAQTGGQTGQSLWNNLAYNSVRLAYQAVDPTGLPDPLTGYGFKAKALAAGKLFGWLGFPIESSTAVAERQAFVLRERYVLQEDAAWYGPLFAFLVLPGLFYQAWVGTRRKDPLRVGLLLLAFSFLLINAAFRPGWDPYQGRYFIPVVMTSSAAAAFLYQPCRRMAAARWAMAALALVILQQTLVLNTSKPLSGEDTVWTLNRAEMITRQSFYIRDTIWMVERWVPADAVLGLVTRNNGPEYPYFGETFSRRLVHIYPLERLKDAGWMQGQGIEYVLVLQDEQRGFLEISPGLAPLAQSGKWVLLGWIPGPN